ncbi:signal peptide peptidase SppA [Halobacteriovorax sp. DA5]|uniref:signal peptide peptidase SppA n=1 Tax=Halobacteriovorax sp. DA5 TaxID=2067553 RepID=UPI000CCFE179|nr:signal peptide peptidase SppA [Halobacteriovorax sp. DA5]POB14878.1 signal peptide peptidase SppA [Halobacteriovorax sp. DA5]
MSKSKSKDRAVIGLMAMVAVFFVVLILFSAYTVTIFKGNNDLASSSKKSKDKIALIEVEGVIMDAKKTIQLLHRAEADESVKGIILRVNSPGGAVAPTQEIYQEILRIRGAGSYAEVTKNPKPIYASFSSIAASGGYYIGAATEKICSSPGTLTGSIGVIMQFVDLSELYKFAMVNPQTIKAGRYKDIGQPNRSMTKEERALMTEMTLDVHKQFKDDVAAQRSERITVEIDEVAQGQVFSGAQAKKLGLVDDLVGLWPCARQLHAKLELEGDLNLSEMKIKKKANFFSILEDLEDVKGAVKNFVKANSSTTLMYK